MFSDCPLKVFLSSLTFPLQDDVCAQFGTRGQLVHPSLLFAHFKIWDQHMKNDFVARQIESELSSRMKNLPGICSQRDAVSPEGLGLLFNDMALDVRGLLMI